MASTITPLPLTNILQFSATNNSGDLSYALSIFNTIEHPPHQIIIWNTIIRGYSLNSSPISAIEFYKFMLSSGVEPNSYTFPSILKCCARIDGLNEGKQIHGHVLKLGFGFDLFVHTSLINFYAKSGILDDARQVFDKSPLRDVVSFTALITGYVNKGRVKDAPKVFDEMPVRDVVSWNSIVAGYARMELFEEAIDLFHEMKRAGIKPDESTLVMVLSACAQSGDLKTGEQIMAWIDIYAKCDELDKARMLFDNVNNKNVITWNVMIGGYTHTHHYKESLDLFRTMLKSNYEAKEITLLSVIPACAHMGALDLGKWIHIYIEKNFPESSNMSLFTSLIDMYAKCGDIEAAKTVFENVKPKSVASWNSMISLFEKMIDEKLTPDDIAFVGVLSACSHANLVNLGQHHFSYVV